MATAPTRSMATRGSLLDIIAPVAAVVLPLAVYLRTLAPGEVGGDAGEFQLVPAVLGIPHYTGYPLYTLLGRLWIALDPFGTPAVRMNLLSALCGALACGLVYAGARTLGGGRLAGLAGAASLAVAPLEWRWATIAGVRAAAAAFTALVLLLAFRWGVAARPDQQAASATDASSVPAQNASGIARAAGSDALLRCRWLWLCFGLGLALTHHRSSAFFLPALAVYALLVAPRFLRQWRLLLRGLLLFALPLLLYLYLPIRSALGAAYDQFHPTTWPNFIELVFAPQLSKALLSIPPAEYPARALLLGQALRAQLGLFTWFAAFGLAIALRYRLAEMAAAAAFGLLVCAQVVDWNIPGALNVVYLIPVLVVCAYLVAAGVEGALALLMSTAPRAWRALWGARSGRRRRHSSCLRGAHNPRPPDLSRAAGGSATAARRLSSGSDRWLARPPARCCGAAVPRSARRHCRRLGAGDDLLVPEAGRPYPAKHRCGVWRGIVGRSFTGHARPTLSGTPDLSVAQCALGRRPSPIGSRRAHRLERCASPVTTARYHATPYAV